MDQLTGFQESVAPERTKDAPDLRVRSYRQLAEGVLRLHALAEPAKLIASATELIRHLFGCAGVLVIRGDGLDESHAIGGAQADTLSGAQIALCAGKAMDAGQPVIDGQGPGRAVAVPLLSGAKPLGAIFLIVGDLERRLGAIYLDLLMLLGRHLGSALENTMHARALGSASAAAGDDLIPPGLSLSETLRAFERKVIRLRLRETKGNIAAAARILDIDRGQLSRVLKRLGIDRRDFMRGAANSEA